MNLSFNLKTVQWIQTELDDSDGDYEGLATWKPHFDRYDWKRTPEFVGEIQVMIVNDPSKSIRSSTKGIGVTDFQAASAWRQSFWIKSCIFNRSFLTGSDSELTEKPLTCYVPARCTDIYENQIPTPHRGVWSGH